MNGGIYQITNQTNGNRYIGSAVNLQKRWQNHLSALRHGRHGNRHLQRAYDKYGEGAFELSVLEYVENPSQLIPCEQHFFDMLSPEYNVAPTAGSALGVRHSLETRRKMSKARMGRRNPNYGKHPSPETRAKLSAAHKGKHPTAETLAKRSAALRGHPVSDATRAKISAALSGERNPNFGKHASMETRQKMSGARKGKRFSKEHRQKISVALKAHWRRVRAMGAK